jgi:hypothetical protein
MSELNLFQRINEIRKKIDYIQKDKSVSTGGGSYRAVTHDAVTGILRQHLIEFGVVCVPNLIASKANDRVGDAKQFRYDATYSFDFINCDKPAEKLTITIEAHAMDNADKAPGKALSYAKKYAVLKLFEIETGEDDESRYQTSDVDTEFYIDMIKSAETMDILKKVFAEGFGVANTAKDKDAAKLILNAKDKRKAELSK